MTSDATRPSRYPRRECGSRIIHTEHDWNAGRWWGKRMRHCNGVQPAPPSMYQRLYEEAREVILSVWRLHGRPNMQPDTPGFGAVGRQFFCDHCRMEWPCETALLVINNGTTERVYEPLRLISHEPDPDARAGS